MAFEHYIRSGSRFLRCGYTTGTCAALAAGGAAALLLFGHAPKTASVVTPKGVAVEAELLSCSLQNGEAVCAVRKDAGDDADVTAGAPEQTKQSRTWNDSFARSKKSGPWS